MTNPLAPAPAVRRLVLFKHGVAFLEHAGPVSGSFELAFDKDAMNDVLKSFALWVPSGDAQVGAVAFDSPEDPVAALEDRGLDFDEDNTLRGLLTFLRGRRVRLHGAGLSESAGSEGGQTPHAPVEGEVVGLQQAERHSAGTQPGAAGQGETLTLRTADGMLSVLPLGAVRRVEVLDDAARGELQVLMDKSRAATSRAHRSVRVGLSGAASELRVAYTVPAPIWRVSYRLVADDESVTVMAWAIVHNPVDRDLQDVELVLTTGQPVSFVIDLYVPRHVTRAVVEEEVRGGAAPRSFAGNAPPRPPMMEAMAGAAPAAPAPQSRARFAKAKSRADSFALEEPHELHSALLRDAPASMASGSERGEFFEYRLDTPVSLARGGSAMVPIVNTKVNASRMRIWRLGDAPPPDIVLHFKNDTGVVLEEGAAVVYDESGYAGESMVPFRARGAEVRVSFAKDLSMRCSNQARNEVTFQSIRASKAFVLETRERAVRHALRIENDHARPETLLVELPRQQGQRIEVPSDANVEELAAAYRVSLPVPAQGTREAEVVVRSTEYAHVAVNNVGTSELSRWIAERARGASVPPELERILAQFNAAEGHESQANGMVRVIAEKRARQESLTKQLAVLRDSGEEGQERLAVVRELRRLEAEAEALDRDVARVRALAADVRDKARKELLALPSMSAPPPRAPSS